LRDEMRIKGWMVAAFPSVVSRLLWLIVHVSAVSLLRVTTKLCFVFYFRSYLYNFLSGTAFRILPVNNFRECGVSLVFSAPR
jgi:hypothetical protein